MAIRWPLLVRRTHKWLALVVGVQALLWTLTGFYMVAVHIDTIHGDNLVRPALRPRRPGRAVEGRRGHAGGVRNPSSAAFGSAGLAC